MLNFLGDNCSNIGIAFDFTSVNPQTFNVIRQTYEALETIYESALEEVLRKRINNKHKRIDRAIAASLNLEETFGDDEEEPVAKKSKAFKNYVDKLQND